MAGAGYKLFNTGDVLTAAQVNTYLMEQTIMVFANATARDTALSGVLAQGMQCFLKDTNTMQYYSGSAWVTLSTGGDITSVTAGTGISGGGTSGDVTITNSMATAITTKGDLVPGTGSGTFSRLAAGNNGETLVADSSATTGLRWQEPKAGNPVINSAFQVWQRGTSVAGAGGGAYTADRWMLYAGGQGTVSRQATGDTTNLPNVQYCARVQRNNASSDTTVIPFGQSFESINSIPFAGKTVTLSFYARKGANYSSASDALSVTLATGTGTDQNYLSAGYTGAATPISQSATLTTTWQRFSYSATLSSSLTELAIRFQFTPIGTAGAADYFEVTGVQLEVGSVATAFKTQGVTLAGELAACQRYYWRVSSDATATLADFGGIATASSTTAAECYGYRFPVTMRTVPTVLEYANVGIRNPNGTTTAVTTLTLASYGTNAQFPHYGVTVASGLTTGTVYGLVANSSSSAYIGVSAEL